MSPTSGVEMFLDRESSKYNFSCRLKIERVQQPQIFNGRGIYKFSGH